MMSIKELLKNHGGLIAICFSLVLFSGFGQSVFFGAYLPVIREELGLDKTSTGALYAMATIASAIVIVHTGKWLDHMPLQRVVVLICLGLSAGCALMSFTVNPFMLLIAFFLLRQFGQGLFVLASSTSINRYVEKGKGKALAMANFGASAHLMSFPLIALSMAPFVDWRDAWFGFAVFILAVLMPAYIWALRHHETKTHACWLAAQDEQTQAHSKANNTKAEALKNWTRGQVLRDMRFYGLCFITVLSPFVGTVVFFYQLELAQALSMTPIAFAASFPFFTVATVTFSFLAGGVIDRYGEAPALMTYPVFYSLGLLLLTINMHWSMAYAGMVFLGIGTGIISVTGGPFLAKLYGTKSLGSIKALLFSSSILSSALSPFIFGLFMDRGVGILTLFALCGVYAFFAFLASFYVCRSKPC
jgi:MFS family permease